MEYSVKSGDLTTMASSCFVLGMSKGKTTQLQPAIESLPPAVRMAINTQLRQSGVDGSKGSEWLYNVEGLKCKRLLLIGLGAEKEHDASKLANSVLTGLKQLQSRDLSSADVVLQGVGNDDTDLDQLIRQIVHGLEAAAYRYDSTKSSKAEQSSLKKITFVVNKADASAARKACKIAKAIAEGANYARKLGDLPGNVCTPSYLAKEARKLAKESGLKHKVLSESDMKKLKMGSLLSVAKGSDEPAKMIIMEYQGAAKSEAPIVLVGKGLTFDAGGISIKPAAGMDEMKYDMCGGASVFGAMKAISELAPNKNVVGIVPSTENLINGIANKPGDVVTSMSGITIEILNTDAEGRLILCDALTYAERYKPKAVIDIATLTGACVVALGNQATGLFSPHDELAEALSAAGEQSNDRAWRMPVWDGYDAQLKSNFADVANIGGRGAGAVTAACFLKKFTQKLNWAHLDIAGTAWNSGGKKGATGRPVGLLVQYILDN